MTMPKGKTAPPKKKKGAALRVITLIGISAFFLGAFIGYHVNNIDIADTVVSYTGVSQELLDAIHRSDNLGWEYVLRPAPIISASQTYHLGSVFVPDEYPLRHTPNCHVPEDKLSSSLPMNEIPSFRQARAFDPRADISHLLRRAAGQSPKVRLSLGLNEEVTFRYSEGTVTSVDPVPLRDSLKTIHCVADIASKPVLALAIIYSVQEHYASQGGIKADVKVAMKDDDIVFRYGDNGKFVLEDKSAVPRIWALIPFLYHVEELRHDWKLRRRREFVENKLSEESDEIISISTPDLKGVVFRIE